MNELHGSFEARGLTIVGVTSEPKAPTEQWVEKHGVKHAYAYDPKGQLQRYFGVNGIPHAILIDPSGTVVWRGHPGKLDDATVEAALAGAVEKPLWTWPDSTTAAQLYLHKRAYADALAAAKQVEGPYADLVQGLVTARLTEVRQAMESGDFLRAAGAAERSSRDLAGLPEAEQARELMTKLQEDPKAKRVMQGQRELKLVQAKVETVRLVTDAQKLLGELEALRDSYQGTIVANVAEVEIESLRKRMP